ncbi:MAG: hypothetical protein ACE5J9_09675 [Methanosarcinales archaeon]
MELWNEAIVYYQEAMNAIEEDKAIELYDKAISCLLLAAEQEKSEKNRLILSLNALQAESNKYTVLANMLKDVAYQLQGNDAAKCLTDAANYHLFSNHSRKEAAEIAKKIDDMAAYYNLLGGAYQDKAFYHSYLALASQKINNLDSAKKDYKKALELLEISLEHYNKSLNIKFNPETENNRLQCLKYLENFRADITTISPSV